MKCLKDIVPCFISMVQQEQFSLERRPTKTKGITRANQRAKENTVKSQ